MMLGVRVHDVVVFFRQCGQEKVRICLNDIPKSHGLSRSLNEKQFWWGTFFTCWTNSCGDMCRLPGLVIYGDVDAA